MSKFPNIFLPALGGTAVILGVAFGMASRDYGDDKIDSLEARLQQVTEQAAQKTQEVATLSEKVAAAEATVAEAIAAGPADLTAPAPAVAGRYGLGRAAHAEEIAAWDVDVLPDGRGLPEGSGDVMTGDEVFYDKCASCHGDFAEGAGNWPVLAGGFDTLADEDPVKTVGSYWPHLSTAWDYISRSMPFGEAGTLTADETYAIVAYILYSNDLVDDDFVLSRENFADFDMYNMNGFVVDDRPEAEYAAWRTEPCMKNCKPEVEVTMRSVFLVETPPEGGSNSVMNPATIEGLPSFSADGPAFIPEAAAKPVVVAAAATPAPEEEVDLAAAGEKVFRKCKACHAVGDGADHKSGPHLNGLMGRTMGGEEGFKYSKVFAAAAADGRVWDAQSLSDFLEKPKAYMKGTKMAFSGLKKEADRAALVEYLKQFDQ